MWLLRWLGYLSGGLSLLRIAQRALALEFHAIVAAMAELYHTLTRPVGVAANALLAGMAGLFGWAPPPIGTDVVVLYLLVGAAFLRSGVLADGPVGADTVRARIATALIWALMPVLWPVLALVTLSDDLWGRRAFLRELALAVLAFLAFLLLNAGLTALG
jgi:hypothetical protein